MYYSGSEYSVFFCTAPDPAYTLLGFKARLKFRNDVFSANEGINFHVLKKIIVNANCLILANV